MRILVTGATGFVGSAVVQELLGAGYQVLGLARSEASAASLAALGVGVVRGSVEDVASLERAAAAAEAVVHTAFNHDFSRYPASCEDDRRAVEALGAALEGTTRPLIVTSAIGALPNGSLVTEDTSPEQGSSTHVRAATERGAASARSRGAHVSIVRLPPSVHGPGDPHFVRTLLDTARQRSTSVFLDAGQNRWPAVHRLDAAQLFRLILERRPDGGTYHAVAEEGIPFRDIATTIGQRLHLPVVSQPRSEAAQHFGGFARFATLDVPASSVKTRSALGWTPGQLGLLADIEHNYA
jgi:nucleoside-diphosphate-sugar epimerase